MSFAKATENSEETMLEASQEGSGAPGGNSVRFATRGSAHAARLAASRSGFEIAAFHDKMRH
ncbi:hypothetical protein AB4Y40_40510 [Paraburkholderia sp. EG287B]|uniref:hypothetical protein n=1 Tax=Paraburkholderia sp. EG287B TaxID=3237010 RepID=UPI0034D23E84